MRAEIDLGNIVITDEDTHVSFGDLLLNVSVSRGISEEKAAHRVS
jgi:hypothetical protein